MRARNEYKLPVRKEDVVKVDRTTSPAHKGHLKNAVDFIFTKIGDFSAEGRPIYSAADGEVVWLRDSSNKGGPDEKYWFDGNGILIRHASDEFTYYEHLKYKGATVVIGQRVRAGELIGYSGNTGYTFGSHLHFEVRKFIDPFDGSGKERFETLEVKFKELEEFNRKKKYSEAN